MKVKNWQLVLLAIVLFWAIVTLGVAIGSKWSPERWTTVVLLDAPDNSFQLGDDLWVNFTMQATVPEWLSDRAGDALAQAKPKLAELLRAETAEGLKIKERQEALHRAMTETIAKAMGVSPEEVRFPLLVVK